jgi:hypothetical protein
MSKRKKKSGRKPKIGATRHTIRVTDAVWRAYERFGDGDATRGIERGAAWLDETTNEQVDGINDLLGAAIPIRRIMISRPRPQRMLIEIFDDSDELLHELRLRLGQSANLLIPGAALRIQTSDNQTSGIKS